MEAAASKLGLRHPALSDKQRQMSVVKLLGTAGSAIGLRDTTGKRKKVGPCHAVLSSKMHPTVKESCVAVFWAC